MAFISHLLTDIYLDIYLYILLLLKLLNFQKKQLHAEEGKRFSGQLNYELEQALWKMKGAADLCDNYNNHRFSFQSSLSTGLWKNLLALKGPAPFKCRFKSKGGYRANNATNAVREGV